MGIIDDIRFHGLKVQDMKTLNFYFDSIEKDNLGMKSVDTYLSIFLPCGKTKNWPKRSDVRHENVQCACGCEDLFIKFEDIPDDI